MTPDSSSRIDAIIKAIMEVIIPALNDDQMATEQVHFVLSNLYLLKSQHPLQIHYRLLEIKEAHTVLSQLLSMQEELPADLAKECRALLERTRETAALIVPNLESLTLCSSELKELLDKVVQQLPSSQTLQGLAPEILHYAENAMILESTWIHCQNAESSDEALRGLLSH